ncbi:MAG: hypothetical protein NZM00_00625 [Anaerolinea sp.]|nr:hypothetical protein [Anaerolinea sp.]
MATRHWSGEHYPMEQGINLISLVWTESDAVLLHDYRLCNEGQDGLSKNDHSRHLLETTHESGLQLGLSVFDSWYSSLNNLNQAGVQLWLGLADADEKQGH